MNILNSKSRNIIKIRYKALHIEVKGKRVKEP